jgi:hypothetical protein
VPKPRDVFPWKNSTLAIPEAALAVALKAMFAGAVNVLPLAGLDMATAGRQPEKF